MPRTDVESRLQNSKTIASECRTPGQQHEPSKVWGLGVQGIDPTFPPQGSTAPTSSTQVAEAALDELPKSSNPLEDFLAALPFGK